MGNMQLQQIRVQLGENTSDIARSFGLSNEALCASNPGRAVERTPWGHVYFTDLQEGDLLSLPREAHAGRSAHAVEAYGIFDDSAKAMVDAAVPMLLARMPEISQSFVDTTFPLVKERAPELVEAAMPEIESKLRMGLVATTVGTALLTSAIIVGWMKFGK